MPLPTITPLPTAPSSGSPATFNAQADAFLGALPAMVTEINEGLAYSGSVTADPASAARIYPSFVSDFPASTSPQGPYVLGAIGTGTVTSLVGTAIESNHPGVVRISSVATLGTGGYIALASTGTDILRLEPGMTFDAVIRQTNASGTNGVIGWSDALPTNGTPVDGVYINLSQNTASLVARSNNVATTSANVTIPSGAWRHIRIQIGAGGTATATAYTDAGDVEWTLSVASNVPTASGRELSAGVSFTNSGTANVVTLDVDYLGFSDVTPLSRGQTLNPPTTPDRFEFVANTAAPNATVPANSIGVISTATNADLVLNPKGSGALIAEVPDSTIAGGNKRGANAVDWQTDRAAAAQVASGAYSVISGGRSNIADGAYSAVVGGWFGDTRGVSGVVVEPSVAEASGRTQASRHILRATTTSTTAARLTIDGAAAAATNVSRLAPTSGSFYARIRVIAFDTVSLISKSWSGNVLIRRGALASTTTIVGTPTLTSDFADTGMAAATVAVSADTTLGALNVTGTAASANSTRWAAHVELLEVTG